MQNRCKLTDVAVQRLPVGMHWDTSMRAFGLRVGKRSRTFVCVRSGGQRVTIGRYPSISLQEARWKAKGILATRYEKVRTEGYQEAVARYLRAMEGELRPRTLYEYGKILRRFDFATTAVSAAEVGRALEDIDGLSARAHHYTGLKVFFNWAVRHECADANPLAKLKKPRVPPARERVLTDLELRKVWKACERLGQYGVLVQLLILTGQRKGQFACLKEGWVNRDDKVFVFPPEAMKTDREHRVPFSWVTGQLLDKCIPIEGYYFSPATAIGRPFTAWSKNKDALDKLVGIEPWTLHDLRRTWSTNAARLEVAPHIIERVLSHVAPEGRVASIYNRWKYEKEMQAAADKMADLVLELTL